MSSFVSTIRRLMGIAFALILGLIVLNVKSEAAESHWVFPGATGRLLHHSRATGDRIPDFSAVGFRSGQAPIPFLPAQITVVPSGGDDTDEIQAAINFVSSLPLNDDGFRGAVELTAGEFLIRSSIYIRTSGVVLRGAGDSDSGTILRAIGTSQRTLINVATGGSRLKNPTSERPIQDKYVPVGATSFTIDDPTQFAVGDDVVVFRPSTSEWISTLGMDQIPPRSDGGTVTQWTPGSRDLHSERTITRIEGNRVFIDAPITNSLDQRFGGGTIYRYTHSNRLKNVGIENIKGVSDYDLDNRLDENHSWTFISLDDLDHGWVRGVTSQYFAKNTVSIERDAKHITVMDSHSIDPISQITGGRRYAFEVDGQLNLVRDATSDNGRHDFILNSPSPGPNVFLDSSATNAHSDTGPHQRWSTGGLFDNVSVGGDQINVRNRGNFGTGHGWAGANMVVWNSTARRFIIQNPPTAQNWIIGSVGQLQRDSRFGQQEDGLHDHHGQPVQTRSLYLQQLADRTSATSVEMREYVSGDYDDFVNDGPVDAPFVSDELIAAFSPILTDQDLTTVAFDEVQINGAVPFTWQFALSPGERVVNAVVSLGLKKTDDSALDDSLFYESLANELSFATDLGLHDELSTNEATVAMVEFSSLEDVELFNDGQFNMLVQDGFAVDWARLELLVGRRSDFNGDGVLDAADVDLLCDHFGLNAPAFDLNGDGVVDQVDLEQMIHVDLGTLFGDVNLDHTVDGGDLAVWNDHRFMSGMNWSNGDFNCDGATDGADFNIWNESKFRSTGTASVPEPSGIVTLLLGVSCLFCRRRPTYLAAAPSGAAAIRQMIER